MGSEVTNERPRLRWPVVPSVVSLCPGHGAQLSQAAPGKHHQALDPGSDNDKFWAHNIQGKFLMCPICALTEQSGSILVCQFSLLGILYILKNQTACKCKTKG